MSSQSTFFHAVFSIRNECVVLQVYVNKQSSRGVLLKVALKNFAKFTGKHLCQSLFFNKNEGLRPAGLLKKDSGTGSFL